MQIRRYASCLRVHFYYTTTRTPILANGIYSKVDGRFTPAFCCNAAHRPTSRHCSLPLCNVAFYACRPLDATFRFAVRGVAFNWSTIPTSLCFVLARSLLLYHETYANAIAIKVCKDTKDRLADCVDETVEVEKTRSGYATCRIELCVDQGARFLTQSKHLRRQFRELRF